VLSSITEVFNCIYFNLGEQNSILCNVEIHFIIQESAVRRMQSWQSI